MLEISLGKETEWIFFLFREEVENSQEETASKGIEGEDGEKDSKGQQGMPCRRETHIWLCFVSTQCMYQLEVNARLPDPACWFSLE